MANTPLLLCIMDGYGLGDHNSDNAVWKAKKPNLDNLFNHYPNTKLEASGKAVGLPNGQMGNSEVGHLNIGAGRIVYTGLSMISNAIETKKFKATKAFLEAFKHVNNNKSNLHITGLLSDGGVHALDDHIIALARLANEKVDKNIYIHIITDGRDVGQKSAKEYIDKFINQTKNLKKVKIASISGRLYSMDRDSMFDRTELAYNTITKASPTIKDINLYVDSEYQSGRTDEFIKPAAIEGVNGLLKDGDAFIFANYRPDRARQLSHMIIGSNAYPYKTKNPLKNVLLVSFMKYEGIDEALIAFPNLELKNTLGEVLSKNQLTQLRISETQKYPHVTFFFSGGTDTAFNGMEKILIDSPKVENFGDAPRMSTKKIVKKLIPELKKHDVIILNFPNPDMVGHSGRLAAAIIAVEEVDWAVGELYQEIQEIGGLMIVTADHGNADIMKLKNGDPHTKHTTNLVPFLITKHGIKLQKGALCDIAPTMLDLLNIKKPAEMNGKSLIK